MWGISGCHGAIAMMPWMVSPIGTVASPPLRAVRARLCGLWRCADGLETGSGVHHVEHVAHHHAHSYHPQVPDILSHERTQRFFVTES